MAIPDKYILVTNNELVRPRYFLVYTRPKVKTVKVTSFVERYKFILFLSLYVSLLLAIGLAKRVTVWQLFACIVFSRIYFSGHIILYSIERDILTLWWLNNFIHSAMEISDFRISKDFYRAHDNPSEFCTTHKVSQDRSWVSSNELLQA